MTSGAQGVTGWTYAAEAGENGGGPALLTLHGTGGDEREMVSFGRSLLPSAPILAPRGRVSEHGMARFFRRTAEDPFSFPDLAERIDELASFVREAVPAHGLEGRPLVAVGYSNGANAAAALMLRHPGLLAGGALLRPMLPAPPPEDLDLRGTRVLLAGGRADAMIPGPRVRALATALRDAGAEVTEHWSDAGHGLTQGDLTATEAFLAGFPAG